MNFIQTQVCGIFRKWISAADNVAVGIHRNHRILIEKAISLLAFKSPTPVSHLIQAEDGENWNCNQGTHHFSPIHLLSPRVSASPIDDVARHLLTMRLQLRISWKRGSLRVIYTWQDIHGGEKCHVLKRIETPGRLASLPLDEETRSNFHLTRVPLHLDKLHVASRILDARTETKSNFWICVERLLSMTITRFFQCFHLAF